MDTNNKVSTPQFESQSTKVFVEKSREELPELHKTLDTLFDEYMQLESHMNSIKNFTVPFKNNPDDKNYPSFMSMYGLNMWNEYQRDVYRNWADPSSGKNCIYYKMNFYLYIGSMTIYYIGLIIMVLTKINNIFNMTPLTFVALACFIFEIITGIISIYYWIIRPNYINRRIIKKDMKSLEKKLKIIDNEITIKKNIIQQYEMTQIDPEKEYANMKKDMKSQLRKIIKDSKIQVLKNIDKFYANRYSTILDKAEKLLYLTENRGTSFTEISKIYIIYLNEINSILLRNHDNQSNSIIELFDSFESFLDRKIQKFKNMSDIEINRDVKALINAIKEEEELE